MSDGLRLNTLSRFSKQSNRLVLEEHGHCEVPAGCGGVVMRWHDPNEGAPLIFYAALTGEGEYFITGVEVVARRIVPYGEHVLAVHCSQLSEPRIFAFAAARDTGRAPSDDTRFADLCSEDNGQWLAATDPPHDDQWLQLEFDDAAWTPMQTSEAELEVLDDSIRWRFHHVVQLGGALLAAPAGEEIWIRKRFAVERQA